MSLHRVFEPIKIGNVEVPNRIVRSAHGTQLSPVRHTFHPDLVNYHVARAKGGVGLSVLEVGEVRPSVGYGFAVWDERIVATYRDLMAAVRPHGMRMFQQLWDGGNLYPYGNGDPPWGVSTMPSPKGLVPRPMSVETVQEYIEAYARAAVHCREGGLDGVEFHAAHGYLPYQFLSPVTNTRTDEFGGTPEKRMRFVVDGIRRIRAAVGRDFVVGIRVGTGKASKVDEDVIVQLLNVLQAEKLIDYVSASMSDYFAFDGIVGGMDRPVGYQLPSSAHVRAAAKVPKIVVGRFRTLEEVEQVLKEGAADMVSMVRAAIADPDLVKKTRENKVDQVRPCIACNQGCVGGLFRIGRLGCAVNPAVGFEATLSEDLIQKTATPKRVLVIGGGPAGMEAARIAALMGHRVKLMEASGKLGGLINVAKRAPRLHTIGDITYWQESELTRLGVEIALNTYADADDVRAERPDIVFIATGSTPRQDGYQASAPLTPIIGHDLPHVKTSVDILTAPAQTVPKSAMVFDDLGSFEAIAAAEHLVAHGTDVTFVTSQNTFGGFFVVTTERDGPALERLYAGPGGFRVQTRARVREIKAEVCVVGPMHGEQSEMVRAQQVVLVLHNEPERALYDELQKEFPNIHLIGDARSPRDLQAAMFDGHLTPRFLPALQ